MDEATIALVIMSVLILLVFLGFLIWGWKSGQFKNVEEAKYQLFKSDQAQGESNDKTKTESEGGEKKC